MFKEKFGYTENLRFRYGYLITSKLRQRLFLLLHLLGNFFELARFYFPRDPLASPPNNDIYLLKKKDLVQLQNKYNS